jgi:phage-related protein
MKTLPSGWSDRVNALHATSPFVWCFRIPLVRSTSMVLFATLTDYREEISIAPETYYPWPIQMSAIEERGDGSLPSMSLSIGNRPRLLAEFLESPGDETGMFGRRVLARVLNIDDLSQAWSFAYQIAGCTLNDEAAVLRLEHPNYLQRLVPQERHNPSHCRWAFGSEECGYVINSVAAYTTCPKTLNACTLRGLDMQARRLPKIHPQRFGGFVGIPRS